MAIVHNILFAPFQLFRKNGSHFENLWLAVHWANRSINLYQMKLLVKLHNHMDINNIEKNLMIINLVASFKVTSSQWRLMEDNYCC